MTRPVVRWLALVPITLGIMAIPLSLLAMLTDLGGTVAGAGALVAASVLIGSGFVTAAIVAKEPPSLDGDD